MYGMETMTHTNANCRMLETNENRARKESLGGNKYEAIRREMGWNTFSESAAKAMLNLKAGIKLRSESR